MKSYVYLNFMDLRSFESVKHSSMITENKAQITGLYVRCIRVLTPCLYHFSYCILMYFALSG